MRYLVDTDWVADYLNAIPQQVERLDSLRPQGLAISVMSYGEVYDGIYYGPNPRQAERLFLQFLRTIPVLPLTPSILKRFARVRGDLRRRGQLIGDTDLLIAATALHYRLTLLTRNHRDFERTPNLDLWRNAS